VSEDDEKIAITPAWLNYKQAEAYSNLSRTTLWQLINARKIKAARIGRAVRIERDSLQKFLERCADEAGDRSGGHKGEGHPGTQGALEQ
jgi:excisionase family DNA binding protein